MTERHYNIKALTTINLRGFKFLNWNAGYPPQILKYTFFFLKSEMIMGKVGKKKYPSLTPTQMLALKSDSENKIRLFLHDMP